MRLLHEYPIDIIVTRQLFKGGTALNLLQFLHEKTANKAEVLMLEKHHPSRDEERNNANTNGIHKRADHCDSSVAVEVDKVLHSIPQVIVLQDHVPGESAKRCQFVHKSSGAFAVLSYPQRSYAIQHVFLSKPPCCKQLHGSSIGDFANVSKKISSLLMFLHCFLLNMG